MSVTDRWDWDRRYPLLSQQCGHCDLGEMGCK